MRLGAILRKWRRTSDLSVREAALKVGLSSATFSRVERGEAMDGKVLAKILRWLLESEQA